MRLIAEGHSNQAIGGLLFLSPKTVETHIRQIFMKLGLERRPTIIDACWPCSPTFAEADAPRIRNQELGLGEVGTAGNHSLPNRRYALYLSRTL